MSEPKRRHSKQRQGKRRWQINLTLPQLGTCPACQAPIRPHTACTSCGFYKGRQVTAKTNKHTSTSTP